MLLLRTTESCAESDRIQDEALPGMLELNSTGVEGGLGTNNGTGRQGVLAGGADWSPPPTHLFEMGLSRGGCRSPPPLPHVKRIRRQRVGARLSHFFVPVWV